MNEFCQFQQAIGFVFHLQPWKFPSKHKWLKWKPFITESPEPNAIRTIHAIEPPTALHLLQTVCQIRKVPTTCPMYLLYPSGLLLCLVDCFFDTLRNWMPNQWVSLLYRSEGRRPPARRVGHEMGGWDMLPVDVILMRESCGVFGCSFKLSCALFVLAEVCDP